MSLDSIALFSRISEETFLSVAASVQERLLFEGGFYLRAASIRRWFLFKSGFCSRAASTQGRLLFEGGFYLRKNLYHKNIPVQDMIYEQNLR